MFIFQSWDVLIKILAFVAYFVLHTCTHIYMCVWAHSLSHNVCAGAILQLSQTSRLCHLCGSIPAESGWIINAHILFFTDGEIIWDGFFFFGAPNEFISCLRCQYYFQILLQHIEALIRIPDIVTLLLWPWAGYLTQPASIHIHWCHLPTYHKAAMFTQCTELQCVT